MNPGIQALIEVWGTVFGIVGYAALAAYITLSKLNSPRLYFTVTLIPLFIGVSVLVYKGAMQ